VSVSVSVSVCLCVCVYVLIQEETGSRWRCEDSTTDDSSEFSTDNSSVGNLASASR
jgi:hypothetical protein